MEITTQQTSARFKLSELFQEALMDGHDSYQDLTESNKSLATGFYWDSLGTVNEFEPLVEPTDAIRIINLIKKLLKYDPDSKFIASEIIEDLTENAINYCEPALIELFDSESRVYAFDCENDYYEPE